MENGFVKKDNKQPLSACFFDSTPQMTQKVMKHEYSYIVTVRHLSMTASILINKCHCSQPKSSLSFFVVVFTVVLIIC